MSYWDYWDTSCLVKLYTPEADSSLFRAHLATGVSCLTCDIAPLEFWATVRRKESEGVLAPCEAQHVQSAFEADIAAGLISMIPCDSGVRQRYREIINDCHARTPPLFIRTNDALHLAAAFIAGETEVVATDKRLRATALALGLSVFPPP